MSCTLQLVAYSLAVALGVSWLIAGSWFADSVRKVNRDAGGWRAEYARIVPWWGMYPAGLFVVLAGSLSLSAWAQTCGSNWLGAPLPIALAVLGVGIGCGAIGLLIVGRRRENETMRSTGKKAGTAKVASEVSTKQLRIRKRALWGYGLTSIIAVGMVAAAYSLR